MDLLEKYSHKIELFVRYGDLDTLGHVNNKVYLSYLEESRIAYYVSVTGLNLRNLDFQSVVGNININYKSPIFYGNKLEVYARCIKIGEKSFQIENTIVATNYKKERIIAAQSITTMVSIDMKTGQTKLNSPENMAKIRAYEKYEL